MMHNPGSTNKILHHIVVAMWGRFKGIRGEVYHLMPFVNVTATGLHPGDWFSRLTKLQGPKKDVITIRNYAEGFNNVWKL